MHLVHGRITSVVFEAGLHQWAFDVDSDDASDPHFIIWNPDLRPLAGRIRHLRNFKARTRPLTSQQNTVCEAA